MDDDTPPPAGRPLASAFDGVKLPTGRPLADLYREMGVGADIAKLYNKEVGLGQQVTKAFGDLVPTKALGEMLTTKAIGSLVGPTVLGDLAATKGAIGAVVSKGLAGNKVSPDILEHLQHTRPAAFQMPAYARDPHGAETVALMHRLVSEVAEANDRAEAAEAASREMASMNRTLLKWTIASVAIAAISALVTVLALVL